MAEMESSKSAPEGATAEAGEFASLLQKQFKPQSDRAREEVEAAVHTLAQQALEKSTVIGSDVVESINAMIAAIDKKLSQQINKIMHNPDFQALGPLGAGCTISSTTPKPTRC
jgi:type VI secretion system protein ImpC